MVLKKREFTPESGTVDAYAIGPTESERESVTPNNKLLRVTKTYEHQPAKHWGKGREYVSESDSNTRQQFSVRIVRRLCV